MAKERKTFAPTGTQEVRDGEIKGIRNSEEIRYFIINRGRRAVLIIVRKLPFGRVSADSAVAHA